VTSSNRSGRADELSQLVVAMATHAAGYSDFSHTTVTQVTNSPGLQEVTRPEEIAAA